MKKLISIILMISILTLMMPVFAFADIEINQVEGEYSLRIVNNSDASGKYAVTINGNTIEIIIKGNDSWTTGLDKGDTYSVELISRPDYYSIDKKSVSAVFQAGDSEDAVVTVTGDETYIAGEESIGIRKNQWVTILRDTNGDKLINKTQYTGEGNELTSSDAGKYIQITDKDEIAKLIDCKKIASENSNDNWPKAWQSISEEKYFFNPLDAEIWIASSNGDSNALNNTFTKNIYTNTGTISDFSYSRKGSFRVVKNEDGSEILVGPRNLGSVEKNNIYTSLVADINKYAGEIRNNLGSNTQYNVESSVQKNLIFDAYALANNAKGVYVYQLVEKADIECSLPAAKKLTYTFSADASKHESNVELKLLNEERFNALTEIIDEDLVSELLKNRNELKHVDINSVDSISNLLGKDYLVKAGALLRDENMPLDSHIILKEVDLGDGFYEGKEYNLNLQGHEFLKIDPDYIIKQNILGVGNLEGITLAIKVALLFLDDDIKQEINRVLYIIEKALPSDGQVTIPISLGGRYTSSEKVREGTYELTLANPGKGWVLPEKNTYVKVNEDGTITNKMISSQKAIQLKVSTMINNLVETEPLEDNVLDIIDGIFSDKNGVFLAQETGLWLQRTDSEIAIDMGKYGKVVPGATYLLINKDQLLSLVDALLKLGKKTLAEVNGGIKVSKLKDIRNIIKGVSNGDITTSEIIDALKTALELSDKVELEGIDIPTMLEAVSNEEGVVSFNKNSKVVSIGKITSTTVKTYDEVKKVTSAIERIKEAFTSIVQRVSDFFKGILGVFLNNSVNNSRNLNDVTINISNSDNYVVLQEQQDELNEYMEILGKIGDEELAREAIKFVNWVNSIKEPKLSVRLQSRTINESGNYPGGTSTKIEIKTTDFNPNNFKFAWDDKNASKIFNYEIENKIITITVKDISKVKRGDYTFKISGSYDGLTLSASGKVVVSGPYTPSTKPTVSVKAKDINQRIIQGEKCSLIYNINTSNFQGTPEYSLEWDTVDGKTPKGLITSFDGNTMAIYSTRDTNVGEYEYTLIANDGTNIALTTDSVVIDYSDTQKIINIVNNLGENDLGYSARNIFGLKNGTLPEGNYIMIQTAAPEGYNVVKGTYKVNVKWDNNQDGYVVKVSESILAKLSQATILAKDAIKEISKKLLFLQLLSLMTTNS